MHHPIPLLRTLMALLLAIVLWSSAFIGIRVALNGYEPGGLALFRYLVASLCMVFMLMVQRMKHKGRHNMFERPKTLREYAGLLLIGWVGFGVYNIAINHGQVTIHPALASFVIGLSPVLTAALCLVLGDERSSKRLWWGMGVSVIGLFIIARDAFETAHAGTSVGFCWILLATVSSGVFATYQRRFSLRYGAVLFTSLAIWFGTLTLLPFSSELLRNMQTASLQSTLAVIYLGIFPGAVAYAAWSYAFRYLSATQGASSLYFMPLVTTLMAWAVFGTLPEWDAMLGGCMAMLGALLVQLNRKH